jgi:hypothetical protein
MSLFRPIRPRPARTLLLAAALALACPGGAHAGSLADSTQVFPRLGMPGAIRGNGYPYLDSTGAVIPEILDAVARYDVLIMDVSPVTEYHPEILAGLRARNPGLTALGYVLGHDIWNAVQVDSLVHFPTRYNRLVRDLDGYLYNTRGEWYPTARVNIAKRDRTGRYVVAEAVANLFVDAVYNTGLWDGLFLDVFCDDIDWTQGGTDSIDYRRAGYSDYAAFRAAWKAGGDTLASILRRRCGSDAVLVGNCGQGTRYAWFNGWTRENFPLQNGGTWESNMFRVPGGYFTDDANHREPTCNVIFLPIDDYQPYDPVDTRRVRLVLGSAALGQGVATVGPFSQAIHYPPHVTWWYDEYAVDLATGRASTLPQHTGWLGRALGAWYQMVWVGPGPDAVTHPDFESGVTDGWWFGSNAVAPATLAHDTLESAVGRASARVTQTGVGAAPWYTTFATVSSLPVTAGLDYAATFYAKASKPRRITVAMAAPTVTYASLDVDLGTEWRRYQVVMRPRASANAQLHVHLAGDDGTVWLDDVHLQRGATSVYRRDFQNGIVLVNPSGSAQTVPLGQPFRRILGTVDPVVNDGGVVTQVTVPAADALFLIGHDTTPPVEVRDLRVIR